MIFHTYTALDLPGSARYWNQDVDLRLKGRHRWRKQDIK